MSTPSQNGISSRDKTTVCWGCQSAFTYSYRGGQGRHYCPLCVAADPARTSVENRRERINEQHRRTYSKHQDTQRAWELRNRDRINARRRAYRQDPEVHARMLANRAAWRAQHREQEAQRARDYRRRLKEAAPCGS